MSRIGIAVLFIIESAAFLIGIYMAINSACHPADDVIFIGDITAGQVLANGKVASIHSLTEPRKSVISKFPGRDVSGMFPSLIYLGHPPGQDPDKYTDPAITACIGNRFRSADRWLNSYISQMNYSLDLTRCPMPDGKPGPCFYQPEHISDLKGAVVGDVYYKSITKDMVAIQGKVYKIDGFLDIAAPGGKIDPNTNFFSDSFTKTLLYSVGDDATTAISQIIGWSQMMGCMDRLFYAGLTESEAKRPPTCWVINYPLLVTTAIILAPLLVKILAMDGFSFCGAFLVQSGPLSAHSLPSTAIIMTNCRGNGPESCSKLENCLKMLTKSTLIQQNICNQVIAVFVFEERDDCYNLLLRLLNLQQYNNSQRDNLVFGFYPSGSVPQAIACMVLIRPPSFSAPQSDVYLALKCFETNSMAAKMLFSSVFLKAEAIEYAIICDCSLRAIHTSSFENLLSALQRNESLVGVTGRIKSNNTKKFCQRIASLIHLYPDHHSTYLTPAFSDAIGGFVIPSSALTAYRLRFHNLQPCLLHNKILDGESGIHFNRPCHRYLGIRAMQQFPVMKIGFCKNAIGFCKQPDTFRSLIYGQAIYYKTLLSLRWSFLIDVKSSGLRSIWRKFLTTLDLIFMTLIPAATVLWYLLLAKFAITGGRALVYAFSAGALIAILILHMSILALFQTRFVFLVGLPLFLLIGLPIYGIIIPFIAVTLANVHISGSAIKQRSTQQSDLVEISSDLKGSSVQNRNHYQGTTIEFKTEPRKDSFLTNIDTARTLLKPLHLSAMSVESPTINQRNETLPLYRPTNFDENKPQILPRKSTTQPTSPISASRANSVARSDYSSSYAMSKNYGRVSSYKASRMTARSSKYNSRFAETDTQQHSTIFSKEEIREEIRFILQDSDLNSVSRREIKEHLFVQFGESVEIYSEFINSCIEEFTLEKLALL